MMADPQQITKDDEHSEVMNCSPAILRPDNCHDQATEPRQTFSAAAHIDCRAMPNCFLGALCPRSHSALRRMSAQDHGKKGGLSDGIRTFPRKPANGCGNE